MKDLHLDNIHLNGGTGPKLSDNEFEMIRELVYTRFGINLTKQKHSLVMGRLNSVLRRGGFTSFKQYFDSVLNDKSGEALSTLIDRISTNHTFFFRENDHFNYLREVVLPEIVGRKRVTGQRDFRIWVAGCSSGEESYTIAMVLSEYFGNEINSWDVGVLATDISDTALSKAVNGIYEAENVEKMPKNYRAKYFTKNKDDTYTVKDTLRKMILHRKLNLMREQYPFKRRFSVIFCRNVMIYFDRPTRERLIYRYHKYMEQGAYLFIGHSESLGRTGIPFNYIKPAVYKKEV